METAEKRLPVRDLDVNLENYKPHEGAIFIATDTGAVYDGDGVEWSAASRGPRHSRTAEEPAADVTYYGAVGDGAANDTDAIQDAVDAVPEGGNVYFPAGTYRVTARVHITTENVTVEGGATIRADADLDWKAVLRSDGANTSFRGLEVDANENASKCIRFNQVPGGLIENCTVRNVSMGQRVQGIRIGNGSHDVVIRDCLIEDITCTGSDSARGIGTMNKDNDNITVENTIVRRISSGDDADGIRLDSPDGTVKHCSIEDSDKRAIKGDNPSDNTRIDGCTCYWSDAHGGPSRCGIQIQAADEVVTNCHVSAPDFHGGAGIIDRFSDGGTISDNHVTVRSGSGLTDGIEVVGDTTISGNTIEMGRGARAGIRLQENAGGNAISGNAISGGGDEGISLRENEGQYPSNVSITGGTITGVEDGIVVQNGDGIVVTGMAIDVSGSDFVDPQNAVTTGTNV